LNGCILGKKPGQDPVALEKISQPFPSYAPQGPQTGTENNQNGTADDESNVVLGTGDVGIAIIMKEAKGPELKHYFIEDESSTSVQQVP
jgi:hypothetical protein